MNTKIRTMFGPAVWLVLFLMGGGALAVDATERVAVPPPPGGGDGARTAPLDLKQTASDRPSPEIQAYWLEKAHHKISGDSPVQTKTRDTQIGGDDRLITEGIWLIGGSMDIAENGDIYVAIVHGYQEDTSDPPHDVQFYRSQDGGDSWQSWGSIPATTEYDQFLYLDLLVAEGDFERCYLTYALYDGPGNREVYVAWSDLSSPGGSWTTTAIMSAGNLWFSRPRLATDADSFDGYFLYLVAAGGTASGDDGMDIWFTRSIDGGSIWEEPYVIAEMPTEDHYYWEPDITYGYGGYLHVCWVYEIMDQSQDSALCYRRANGCAGEGLADWGPIAYLTPLDDDVWETRPVIEAAKATFDVVIARNRQHWEGGNSWIYMDIGIACSYDAGVTFPDILTLPNSVNRVNSLDRKLGTGEWILSGSTVNWDMAIQRADASDPTIWSSPQRFNDPDDTSSLLRWYGMALDPSHSEQVAQCWCHYEEKSAFFDAEWRDDPGYPNFEPGFPLDLDHMPLTPPALVDLDGDGNLEIVYSDYAGRIHALHHNGYPVAGWPVSVGTLLSRGPVAIGAMTLGDELDILVGTTDGRVFGYDQRGAPLDGFPHEMPDAVPAYVSIGALGGSYPRLAVVTCGSRVRLINHRGEMPPGNAGWFMPGRTISYPAAIGDVDGNGGNEIVLAFHNRIYAMSMEESFPVMFRDLTSPPSDAPTLGDIDLDGKFEILVPCNDGTMYLLDSDGSDHPGWPVTSASGSPLTSAAIAQILHGYEPDIVWAARDWTVEGYYSTGNPLAGSWPRYTTVGSELSGAPVLDAVNDQYGDVVIGDPEALGWAWTNVGHLIPGWPKTVDAPVRLSPAAGDIDLDGSLEVVILSDSKLSVVDVNNPPDTAHFRWPMYGHDPQRTGCHNCPEDVTTSVPDGQDGTPGITRVSFATPSPNPMSGAGVFGFSVPVRAAVALEVFDLRGHRVRIVFKAEVEPGYHTIAWDGRDRLGRDVAAGQYVARLQVRGPGLQEEMVRKIVRLH